MSFKRELDLEERLNSIASKAVREPSQEEYTNPFKSSVSGQMPTSKEQIDIDDMRQLSIEAQLAKISTNAIVDKLGVRPSKIKSDVTKEMILDYQNEMIKPIEIGGVKYKYHPSSLDLDEIAYAPIHQDVLSDAEEKQARDEMSKLSKELPKIEKKIQFYDDRFEALRSQFDKDVFGDINIPYKVLEARFDEAMNSNAFLRQKEIEKYQEIERRIEEIQYAINSNQMKKSENQAEATRVKNTNKARLKAYEEDLNLLNRGRMNVTRQPNETDEEYRERLTQTGQMTISEDDMAQSADLYNRDKLRELVMELVRDTGIISNAIKFLDGDQVFKINQNWSRIKRDFLKVYGFDNKTVKEQDLIDFFLEEVDPIIDAVNKGKAPPTADLLGAISEQVIGQATAPEAEVRIPQITVSALEKMTVKQLVDWIAKNHVEFAGQFASITGKPNKIKFIVEQGWTEKPTPQVPITASFKSAKRVYSLEELKEKSTPFLEKLIQSQSPVAVGGADEEAVRKAKVIIASARKALASTTIDKFYEELDKIEAEETNLIKNSLPDIYPRAITGSGLQPIKHDIPNLIEFGKVKISPRKLYYNNTLAIKHKSGNSLVGLPNVQVSDKFVSIIMNLLKGQKPSLKDFTQLELNEKGVYDSLIYIAGLQKEVDNNFSETKQHLKNRLELIEGEIGAGNNNPKLKKELHSLLGKMAHTGMIGYGDAKRYYTSVTKKV
jgi:hypothetical protein